MQRVNSLYCLLNDCMKTKKLPSDYTYATFHGLLISLMLVVYFLLIRTLDYGHISAFRFFNIIIVAFGIFSALKQYLNQNDKYLNIQSLYKLGAKIAIIAVVSFAFFIFLYLNVFNVSFMEFLIENSNLETFISPTSIVLTVLIEGLCSTLIIAFIAAQYLKKNSIKNSSY